MSGNKAAHLTSKVTRRELLEAGTGITAAGLIASMKPRASSATQSASPVPSASDRSAIVLVHGTYAGAWIWKKVIPLLRAAGHDVFATTATGMGDRSHLADPSIDSNVFFTDVANLLEYEDLTDVTLVGWSFGGWIITGAAELAPKRLKQLVYLDGAVPEDGQSNYVNGGYSDEAIGFEYRAGVEVGWPGFEVVHAGVEEFIRSLTKNPDDAEWVLSKLTPQPMAVSSTPIKLGNPEAAALPRTYIVCTEGREIAEDPFIQRLMADPGWRVTELADNHLAPINAPELTAEAILSVV